MARLTADNIKVVNTNPFKTLLDRKPKESIKKNNINAQPAQPCESCKVNTRNAIKNITAGKQKYLKTDLAGEVIAVVEY